MKKLKYILLGMVVGVGLSAVIYLATRGDVDWEKYLRETLAPSGLTGSVIFTLAWAFLRPVCNAVTNSAGTFDLARAAADKSTTTAEVAAARLEETSCLMKKSIAKTDALSDAVFDNQKILKMGFCNMDELVRKDVAIKIKKAGEVDEAS